jgi:ATP-dependent exoDNAse (exonuclease V) beta subunit
MRIQPFDQRMIRASAGSGKTHQLTNRYLVLLTANVSPETILATTFTRKAAAEILDRLLVRLSEAAIDDSAAEKLAKEIDQPSVERDGFIQLLRKLLKNLHRLRVGTLDSFTISLARAYSLEMGLPAGWAICEEAEELALQSEALEQLLERHTQALAALLPLLNKGESQRSVHGELQSVISKHYETYLGSAPSAWEGLQLPEPIAAEEMARALKQLKELDLTPCGHPGFAATRDKDAAACEDKDWSRLLDSGLAARALSGERYYGKEIPADAQNIYATLMRYAGAQVVSRLAAQTRATWETLDRYHSCLWDLKERTGKLRFGDVTRTVSQALKGNGLEVEGMNFRLDRSIDHILLDEFQDTSLDQWRVLQPLVEAICKAPGKSARSFFCVGDVKQAIYGWRGGIAEIFDSLPAAIGDLHEEELAVSQRSAQPIIDVVNKVFGSLNHIEGMESCQAALAAWQKRFVIHTTCKQLSGYVLLGTGPAMSEGENAGDQRGRHCQYVAKEIAKLVSLAPACSIGVLCRTKNIMARMIYELRERKINASQEGGNPLTDSPAVELLLSLLMLADHPGHSAAWFHLRNSPLSTWIDDQPATQSFARGLRRNILDQGYGPFVYGWAKRLAPACNERDLSRLQQLVDMAYTYQPRSTLRADDFVNWVRQTQVPDPSNAKVQVMTIHAAKGLQFDAVVLPELDTWLVGQPQALVVGRDAGTLNVDFVCRYAGDMVQKVMSDADRKRFAKDRQRWVEESLSLLYVAMTRAIRGLYLYVPGLRQGNANRKESWHHLLRQTLAPDKSWSERALLYERGVANWFEGKLSTAARQEVSMPTAPSTIAFREHDSDRRRGMRYVLPSGHEEGERLPLAHLFNAPERLARAAGQLYHAWFVTVEWLEDGLPAEQALRTEAQRLRDDLPVETWRELESLVQRFLSWLENPAIACLLKRSAYKCPNEPGFPAGLAPYFKKISGQKVERERTFLYPTGVTFQHGSIDRIVWLLDGNQVVGADVIDFKTDAIRLNEIWALGERVAHYRPQLEAYRRAAARLGRLPPERVTARLVFTEPGLIEEI